MGLVDYLLEFVNPTIGLAPEEPVHSALDFMKPKSAREKRHKHKTHATHLASSRAAPPASSSPEKIAHVVYRDGVYILSNSADGWFFINPPEVLAAIDRLKASLEANAHIVPLRTKRSRTRAWSPLEEHVGYFASVERVSVSQNEGLGFEHRLVIGEPDKKYFPYHLNHAMNRVLPPDVYDAAEFISGVRIGVVPLALKEEPYLVLFNPNGGEGVDPVSVAIDDIPGACFGRGKFNYLDHTITRESVRTGEQKSIQFPRDERNLLYFMCGNACYGVLNKYSIQREDRRSLLRIARNEGFLPPLPPGLKDYY